MSLNHLKEEQNLLGAPIPSSAPVRSNMNLTGFGRAALLAALASGCTETTVNKYYITNEYEVPETTTTTEYVQPEQCGIVPTAETKDLPAIPFYGPDADGTRIAILVKEEELDKANKNAGEYYSEEDGYIDYVPGEGNEADMEDEAVATVCITPVDDSMTVCAEVPFKIVGGMTRTEWHGAGEGELDEVYGATIPSLNLDLNQIDSDFKVEDTFSGRELDNVRLNSGQSLGLASAAISYDLAAKHGVFHRPTSYVFVTSNVWGIDETTGDCVTVPQLNVMRDQDGTVCEFNEDGLMGECSFGLEGYSISSPSQFTCEWSKDDAGCDTEVFNNFADAVNTNTGMPGFAAAVEPYVDQDAMITMIADEHVQSFWDGYLAGNNQVFSAAVEGASTRFYPEPYSRDLALLGSPYGYWVDFTWGDVLPMGYIWDQETCQKVADKVRELNATMVEDCTATVSDHYSRMEAVGALRSPDAEVFLNKYSFCADFPSAIDEALPGFYAHCEALSAVDSGFVEEDAGFIE